MITFSTVILNKSRHVSRNVQRHAT